MRVVYGINPVREALKSDPDGIGRVIVSESKDGGGGAGGGGSRGKGGSGESARRELLKLAGEAGVSIERMATGRLTSLTGTEKHQNIAAEIPGGFAYSSLDEIIGAWKKSGKPALIMILDSIEDPRNLGAIIRSAHAAGVFGVIIPKDRSASITPAASKTSAGATEHTLVARVQNLNETIKRLKKEGVWIAGIEANGEADIYSGALFDRDLAIVIGGEGVGIRRLVRKNCDYILSIPMHDAGGVGSLNAAQAASIVLFEALRQRRRS